MHRAERLAADRRLDTKKIAGVLSGKGCSAIAFDDNRALMEEIRLQVPLFDRAVLVFFTNGSFDGIQHETAAFFDNATIKEK